MIEIRYEKTHGEIVADKLLENENITKEDVKKLEIFNDSYIDMLFNSGDETVKYKVAEAITRSGLNYIKG